ncbi:isochorismatase family protein [Corynebacterium sp. H128]|uniref:isochorismatase family protein n=1 Tax=unclassified Corynebacterium TaxID=2624378 RepID=UPI0030B72285
MENKHALLIVDTQNDFCPGGALPAEGGNLVGEKIADLVMSDHGYDYVLATRDWHIDPGPHFSKKPDFVDTWPVHCKAGTLGAEFHPALELAFQELPPDAEFLKGQYTPVYSGFEGSCNGVLLEDYLREKGISHLDIAGIATDFVVRETAMDAIRRKFRVRILTDLVAQINADYGQLALDELSEAGAELV